MPEISTIVTYDDGNYRLPAVITITPESWDESMADYGFDPAPADGQFWVMYTSLGSAAFGSGPILATEGEGRGTFTIP